MTEPDTSAEQDEQVAIPGTPQAASEDWSVQDLTPEELAGLAQIAGTEGGLGCCMDSEEAGLGDDQHGLEVAEDGATDQG